MPNSFHNEADCAITYFSSPRHFLCDPSTTFAIVQVLINLLPYLSFFFLATDPPCLYSCSLITCITYFMLASSLIHFILFLSLRIILPYRLGSSSADLSKDHSAILSLSPHPYVIIGTMYSLFIFLCFKHIDKVFIIISLLL